MQTKINSLSFKLLLVGYFVTDMRKITLETLSFSSDHFQNVHVLILYSPTLSVSLVRGQTIVSEQCLLVIHGSEGK